MTIGEILDEAVRIMETKDGRQAERFISERTGEMQEAQNCTYREARNIVLSNIAYMAGYMEPAKAVEVRRFYRTSERI